MADEAGYYRMAADDLHHKTGLPVTTIRQRLAEQPALSAKLKDFREALGDRSAGSWLDSLGDGRAHVGVLDRADEDRATKNGLVPHRVRYATAQLDRVKAALDEVGKRQVMPPNSAWSVDTRANRVSLELSARQPGGLSVQQAARKIFTAAGLTQQEQARVRVDTSRSTLSRHGLVGGDDIQVGGNDCSAGLGILQGDNSTYILTAGHCGNVGDSAWRNDGGTIGTISEKVFGAEGDYALIGVRTPTSWRPFGNLQKGSPEGTFNTYKGWVTQSQLPDLESMYACGSGRYLRWECGSVVDSNASMTDEHGVTTNGLVRAINMRSQHGDSGGAVMWGGMGLGTIVGGNGQGVTYIQPVARVIDAQPGRRLLDWQKW
ncbi:hypothetical protein ADK54_33325 [Streptomyces sp. WM6378]|nr:hypothetical protein ADK54_33325 [Streptomyces sp. WM6378]